MIDQEHQFQRQIDRACASQSPDLLPSSIDDKKLEAAQNRVKAQISKYEQPCYDW